MFTGAKWIWTQEETKNQYIELRTVFALKGDTSDAIIKISADNEYFAYINGQYAGGGQYDDFPMHKAYNTHDISALVKEGENELLIRAYHQGENSYQYLPGPAGVIFALTAGENRIVSGEDCMARPYTAYESGPIEKVSGQLGYTFHVDLTAPEAQWAPVRIVGERAATELYPRPIKDLVAGEPAPSTEVYTGVYVLAGGDTPAKKLQQALIAPVKTAENADGRVMIFDLGRETAGLAHIDVSCASPCELLIGYGEHLDDGRVRSWVGNRNFGFSIKAKAGENAFTHLFRRISGRYLQIFMPFDAQVNSLTIIPVDYPVDVRGAFEGVDRLMNKVYDTSVRTLRLCMHEHYEDTPWREQGLYAMDGRNQALCGYTAFGESDFPLACLKLMAEGIRPDGLLDICAPAADRITIPSFSLGWIISLHDFALYTGRVEDAGALLPAAQKLLGFFRSRLDENGLIETPTDKQYWNFYEWAPGIDDGWEYGRDYVNDGSRRDAPLCLFYAVALGHAADVAEWFGDNEMAAGLRAEKQAMLAAVEKAFWDEAAGLYLTYTSTKPHYCQLVQSLALIAGAATGDRARKLRKAIAEKDARLVPATLSYLLFVYEALLGDDEFRAAAVEDARQLWGSMTLRGATSFWETIDGADAFADAGSLCHGWSAVPAWLWYAGYLGVQPTEPGFKKFTFKPLPDACAKAVIPTPYGDIKVDGNEITYNTDKMTKE
ncbi:MAG: hypothetical protein IJC56_07955 [Clostridia bacterium]|nr:hypothetical protein [Clostridia bacterium]